MDDARIVRVFESAGNLQRNRHGVIERQSAAIEPRLQRFTLVSGMAMKSWPSSVSPISKIVQTFG